MVLTLLVPYCALKLNLFVNVDIVFLSVSNSCVAPTFSFEWNKELLDLTLSDGPA